MAKIRKIILFVIFNFVVVALVFFLCEGLSSTIFIAHEIYTREPLAARLYTEYDETLGWINLPSLYIEDLYAPGMDYATNSQRFRNQQDFSAQIPDNKVRIICSGDSFTLGFGVSNHHTWCQQLISLNDRLETVNMGQGGYGIGQAFLWYQRDGTKLDHDILIFAFITDDFRRMQQDEFLGYSKPLLVLEEGILTTRNVPVPKPTPFRVWFNRNRSTINQLSSIRLLRRLFFQNDTVTTGSSGGNQGSNQAQQVALSIFQELQQINQAKDSTLVLVHLPTMRDYNGDESALWRQFLQSEAEKHEFLFIDLIDEFRNLPPETIDGLFIPEGVMNFQAAGGHYTEEGNTYIAETLYEELLTIPEISDILEQD